MLIPAGFYVHPGNISPKSRSAILSSYKGTRTGNFSTIIGSNSSRSTYFVSGNLSVARNTSLKLVNTVLEFTPSPTGISRLSDKGTLRLYNSEITLSGNSPGNSGINISVTGGSGINSALRLFNSTISANGSIYAHLANVTIQNSSISGQNHGAHMSEMFSSSFLLVVNSTISGFRDEKAIKGFKDGLFTGNTNPPVSGNHYISMSLSTGPFQEARVNSIKVSLTYGGYTLGNESELLFNLSGATIYGYTFMNTGKTANTTTVNFTISLSRSLPKASMLEKTGEFTVCMIMTSSSSYSTLFSLSATVISNDTVNYYGKSSFGPVLNGSTAYMVNSGMQLSYNRTYVYGKLLNPDKNQLFLENGTRLMAARLYVVGKSSAMLNRPFLIENSSVELFAIQEIKLKAAEGEPTGIWNRFVPNNQNASQNLIASVYNSEIWENLTSLGFQYTNISKNGIVNVPLVEESLSQSTAQHFQNYFDDAASQVSYFSENTTGLALENSTAVNFELSLPYISAWINHSKFISGDKFGITSSFTSSYGNSLNVTVTLNLTGNAVEKTIAKTKLTIGNNVTKVLRWTLQNTDSLEPGTYNLSISLGNKTRLFNSKSLLFSEQVEVYSNVNISIHPNYRWLKGQKSVELQLNVTNNGGQWANNSQLSAAFYSGYTLDGTVSRRIDVPPGSHVVVPINFSSKSNLTFAYVNLKTQSGVVPYDVAGEQYNLTLILTRYSVIFDGNNARAAGEWSVEVGGNLYSTSTSKLSLMLSNGSYSYRVTPPTGYNIHNATGTLNISGDGVSVKLSFVRIHSGGIGLKIEEFLETHSLFAILAIAVSSYLIISEIRAPKYFCQKCRTGNLPILHKCTIPEDEDQKKVNWP